jgi:ketosteroid isomerase-like protein
MRIAGSVLALLLMLSAVTQVAGASEFEEVLAAHFKAVQQHDLAALEQTLTPGPALELIFPNGNRTTTRAEYVAFHKDWFTSQAWTMRFDPVAHIDAGDVQIVTVKTHYEDVDDGKPVMSESWLTLTFRKERGRWGLIHDQNTRVKSS